MKKQFIKIFAILIVILTLAGTGSAKPANRPEVDIPFDFIVKKRIFPAGKYSVERLNASSPNFLILKQVGGNLSTILLIRTISDKEENYRLELSFNLSENNYFLKDIRAFGEKYTL